jgi:hypothetical protein
MLRIEAPATCLSNDDEHHFAVTRQWGELLEDDSTHEAARRQQLNQPVVAKGSAP